MAVPVGIVVVLLRLSPFRPLRWAAVAWIEVARGTPALVILFLIYFGLPSVFPVDQPQLAHGGRASGSACRAAPSSPKSSARASRRSTAASARPSLTLGLTPRQTMVDVIAPQAWRIALPPVGNYVVGLLKDTSIASIIAAPELMLRAKDLASIQLHADATLRACGRHLLLDELPARPFHSPS